MYVLLFDGREGVVQTPAHHPTLHQRRHPLVHQPADSTLVSKNSPIFRYRSGRVAPIRNHAFTFRTPRKRYFRVGQFSEAKGRHLPTQAPARSVVSVSRPDRIF